MLLLYDFLPLYRYFPSKHFLDQEGKFWVLCKSVRYENSAWMEVILTAHVYECSHRHSWHMHAHAHTAHIFVPKGEQWMISFLSIPEKADVFLLFFHLCLLWRSRVTWDWGLLVPTLDIFPRQVVHFIQGAFLGFIHNYFLLFSIKAAVERSVWSFHWENTLQ